jgi:hypothetical protein
VLTRYRFAWWDGVTSLAIIVAFVALLYGRYVLGRFTMEDSAFLQWLGLQLLPGGVS